MTTDLNIQEIPTNNPKTLILKDTSFYNESIKTENCILEISTPGSYITQIFKVRPDFIKTYNSSSLKILPVKKASQLIPLPDGIYNIKYSVKPNNLVFVEYSLMRNVRILQRYYSAGCDLFTNKCDITKREFEQRREQLTWIKELIDFSKYKVEECGEEQAGLDLYNQAKELLDNYQKCSC